MDCHATCILRMVGLALTNFNQSVLGGHKLSRMFVLRYPIVAYVPYIRHPYTSSQRTGAHYGNLGVQQHNKSKAEMLV